MADQTRSAEHKPSYAEKVAERLVEQLRDGTAPWQRPWAPGELQLPFNPTTKLPYRGFNAMWLLSQDHGDPRWMTYKQAAADGAQVRKGEKGQVIQFVKMRGTEPVLDDNNKPVLDADGKPQTQTVEYERPRMFSAVVFNAEQIDGLPPLQPRNTMTEWQRHERVEAILSASGVPIDHENGNRAYYSVVNDRITSPRREQFATADAYYATQLHELGHATGHPSRLDRDLANPFGSEAYAKEELRAEIASLMLGEKLEIGHDPGQHAAYVASWIKALQDDPREIFRAAADAEKISTYVMQLEHQQTLDAAQSDLQLGEDQNQLNRVRPQARSDELHNATDEATENDVMKAGERVDLVVPYRQKDRAKEAGASWDKERKTWYAPIGADLEKLSPWLSENQVQATSKPLTPVEEFRRVLEDADFVLDDDPIMDGTRQRAKVKDDKGSERSGTYRAWDKTADPNGHPAGSYKNFRVDGKKETTWKWSGSAAKLADVDRERLSAEAAEKRAAREAAQEATHARTAGAVDQLLAVAPFAPPSHPYLVSKGLEDSSPRMVPNDARDLPPDTPIKIGSSAAESGALREAYPNALVFTAGDLLIPIHDKDGNTLTAQTISPEGQKGFALGGKLEGGHLTKVYPGSGKGPASPIVVTEGWATGETIGNATGATVVVAFTAGNLLHVAKALREQHPDRPILLAGDNDHAKARELDTRTGMPKANRGKEAAEEAAKAVNGFAAIPGFDKNSKGTDWNDYQKEQGVDSLRKAMDESMILADRRRLEDAHRTGHDAERVEADIKLHAATAQQDLGKRQGVVGAADTRAAFAALQTRAEKEADRQDHGDESPEKTRKRGGRSRSL